MKNIICIFLLVLTTQQASGSTTPKAELFPRSTVGYFSVEDPDKFSENWSRTQLSQLVEDPAMQPFLKDFRAQMERKVGNLEERLGLSLSDLDTIVSGEFAVGMLERQASPASVLMIANTKGKAAEVKQLLRDIETRLTKRRATKTSTVIQEVTFTIYKIPSRRIANEFYTAVYFTFDEEFCVVSNINEAQELLARIKNPNPEASLSTKEAYRFIQDRCKKALAGKNASLKWFIDPFGYTRASRSLETPAKRAKRARDVRLGRNRSDMALVLKKQGFDAVKGVGGVLRVPADGVRELQHFTMVYAPAVPGAENKYRLAMRMLKLPNTKEMTPQPWASRFVARYGTLNLDIQNAFNNIGSLIDAVVDKEGSFERMVDSYHKDKYGPQIDIRKKFIPYLGNRITTIASYKIPITPDSEQFAFAIEVTDVAAMKVAFEKIMQAENGFLSRDIGNGITIWEKAEEPDEDIDIDIDFLPPGVEHEDEEEEEPDSGFSKSAVSISLGHLWIASDAKFLENILTDQDPQNSLTTAPDYKRVAAELKKMMPGEVCSLSFSRLDEAIRPTYELLRQGNMPRSNTLLGQVLNEFLTTEAEEIHEVARKQRIDGSKLPNFEMVRRYFGPFGTVTHAEENGWFLSGLLLNKAAP